MFDTIPPMPLLDIKGENQNIFQINLDNSENSTRESHPECENSKSFDEVSDINKNDEVFLEPKASKKNFGEKFGKDEYVWVKKETKDEIKFTITQNVKYCQTPFYLWKWRDNSVCRHDSKYILKTYNNMLDSNDALIEEFLKRDLEDKAIFYVTFMIMDAYYTMNKPEWINQ